MLYSFLLSLVKGGNMFYKQLDSGKYRYFEKYFDEKRNKWRQVTVTLKSKSRVAQSEAKNKLARKIEQSKKYQLLTRFRNKSFKIRRYKKFMKNGL